MSELGRIARLIHKARVWFGRKCYDYHEFGYYVVRVSKNRLIKLSCTPAELEALHYVSRHTTIPVPKVHASYRIDGVLYIELEYTQGESLQKRMSS